MTQKFSDNARALLMGSIGAVDTSLTIEASKADRYPVADTSNWASPGDWFKAVIIDAAGNREVIKVGTRALGSGVLGNVLRAQDGTTALAFSAGAVVTAPICAADVEAVLAAQYTGLITQDGVTGRIVPVNGIIMYDGLIADIPTGWALCDGTNGTPDLRDRFIIGAYVDSGGAAKTNVTGAPTKTGGSKDAVAVTHSHPFSGNTGSQSANHTHSGATAVGGAHGHAVLTGPSEGGIRSSSDGTANGLGSTAGSSSGYQNAPAGVPASPYVQPVGDHGHNFTTGGVSADHNHAFSGNTDAAGVSGTNANLVPYYALAFIKCLAA